LLLNSTIGYPVSVNPETENVVSTALGPSLKCLFNADNKLYYVVSVILKFVKSKVTSTKVESKTEVKSVRSTTS